MMDRPRFDRLTRMVATRLSRRRFAGGFTLAALAIPGLTDARHKHKKHHKHKKPTFNAFGCVNVAGFCTDSAQCCSGICEVAHGTATCHAHDQSTCQAGDDLCAGADVTCITTTGDDGDCLRTTGEASYCKASFGCFACTKDADCVAVCGDGAACVVCTIDCQEETGGTACAGVRTDSCGVP
jgi:hypothetical protein